MIYLFAALLPAMSSPPLYLRTGIPCTAYPVPKIAAPVPKLDRVSIRLDSRMDFFGVRRRRVSHRVQHWDTRVAQRTFGAVWRLVRRTVSESSVPRLDVRRARN